MNYSSSLHRKLYELLPSIIRYRDSIAGEPLKEIVKILADETEVVESDITRLYRNWFIETCDAWVIPYLADLLSYHVNSGKAGIPGRNPRREVSKAISYRCRSGTKSLVYELAKDITGWPFRIVEYGDLIATTASTDPEAKLSIATTNIRSIPTVKHLDTEFEVTPKLMSREITDGAQWINPTSGAVFVWRTSVRKIEKTDALPIYDNPEDIIARRFYFDPLGRDIVLHLQPEPDAQLLAESGADPSIGYPIPIQPYHLNCPDTAGNHQLIEDVYGTGKSLLIERFNSETNQFEVVEPGDIQYGNLSSWKDETVAQYKDKSQTLVVIDPAIGKIFSNRPVKKIRATYIISEPTGIGAGNSAEYGKTFRDFWDTADYQSTTEPVREATVKISEPKIPESVFTTNSLKKILADSSKNPCIEIQDSRTYPLSIDPKQATINVRAGSHLEIRAKSGSRPAILCSMKDRQPIAWRIVLGDLSELILDGLIFKGTIQIEGKGKVILRNCTLLSCIEGPETINISAEIPEVYISHCLIQNISINEHGMDVCELKIEDSIVHKIDFGETGLGRSQLTAIRSTFFDTVQITHLTLAENSIFNKKLSVEHRQTGGMRYCFVEPGSTTPRRYECLPDIADYHPKFISETIGQPGYGMLIDESPESITTGADDHGELGALHESFDFHRVQELKEKIQEYMPAGFELKVIPVSPTRKE